MRIAGDVLNPKFNNTNMESDPNEKRFAKLEKKLNFLVALTIGQAVLLAVLVLCLIIDQFMPSTLTVIVMLAAAGAFLYFFRAQIPGWFGRLSRFAFAQMFASQKSNSIKDIK